MIRERVLHAGGYGMRCAMNDGSVVDTKRAKLSYQSQGAGDDWHWQVLHLSSKGRWYVGYLTCVDGERDYAEYVSREEAARWLIEAGHELPEELRGVDASIIE